MLCRVVSCFVLFLVCSRNPEEKEIGAANLQATLSALPLKAVAEALDDKAVQTDEERLEHVRREAKLIEEEAVKDEDELRRQKELEAREWEVQEREKQRIAMAKASAAKAAAVAAEVASRTPIPLPPLAASQDVIPTVLGAKIVSSAAPGTATATAPATPTPTPTPTPVSAQAAKAVSETLSGLVEKSTLSKEREILEELKIKHGMTRVRRVMICNHIKH